MKVQDEVIKSTTPITFYRYEILIKSEDNSFGLFPNIMLRETIFDLVKETPKGYFITQHYDKKWASLESDKIWVSKGGKKRFAYPTKEAALINLIKRKEMRKKILTYQVAICEYGICEAKKQLTNSTEL